MDYYVSSAANEFHND